MQEAREFIVQPSEAREECFFSDGIFDGKNLPCDIVASRKSSFTIKSIRNL